MSKDRLRVPCLQDPVGTACNPDCKNFTYSLQRVRKKAKELGITTEEFAERFPQEADRLAHLLMAPHSISNKMFRRCTEQPNKIGMVRIKRRVR